MSTLASSAPSSISAPQQTPEPPASVAVAPPAPAASQTATPLDMALWFMIRDWANSPHGDDSSRAAAATRVWAARKGLV